MPVRIVTIAFYMISKGFPDEELARFLINKHVTRLEPFFFQADERAYWTVWA